MGLPLVISLTIDYPWKERSVLIQFFVCLTLTFLAFVVEDVLITYGDRPVDQIFNLANLFSNPFLAAGYLSIPYLLMLTLDIRSRKRRKKDELLEEATVAYLEDVATEQKAQKEHQTSA